MVSTRFFVGSWLFLLMHGAAGVATCELHHDDDCKERYGPSSVCRADGICTVPDIDQGCLQWLLPEWTEKRVCNSEDPPDATERGVCVTPVLPYTEIRLYGGNWASRVFATWLVQIILSELLGVPASVEGGIPEATLNLYDSSKPLNYGISGGFKAPESFKRANTLLDCTKASKDPTKYESCAHGMVEEWDMGAADGNKAILDGIFEAPTSLGMMGREAVFVTKFTLEREPLYGTYFGLQGEERRQKLAEEFLRPTTWKDYCNEVSLNNCTTDDGVAKRYPQGELEEDRMFVEGVFIGHFRATEENDCSLNNETFQCTGHVGDYPCGWTSFLEPQMYHLGIPLQSSGNEPGSRGYTYQQQVDMWNAANATKSNLMMFWWTPDVLYEQFMGTEAEMIPVTFPSTTQECLDNRVYVTDTCHESREVRLGGPLGICEEPVAPLRKAHVKSLQEISNNPGDPTAIYSPAYDALRLFHISEYQLSEIFTHRENSLSSRQAVCRWAAENLDYLQTFVPQSYPRVVEKDKGNRLTYATTIVAACVSILVIVTAITVYKKRNKEAIKLAQIGFLQLLLAGSFMISVGAIMTGVKPTNPSCALSIWFVNIGYTLELVPLIVKVGAICTITHASQRMNRKVIKREHLYGVVGAVLFVILIYLAFWSGLDTPEQQVEYRLTSEEDRSGATVIRMSYYCASESDTWEYVAVGWNVLLLFIASAWAFQMRRTHRKLNETATLAFMIYSHFIFVMLRVITLVLSDNVEEKVLQQMRSLIFSFDTTATIFIYFVPKLTATEDFKRNISDFKKLPLTQQLSRVWSSRQKDPHMMCSSVTEPTRRAAIVGIPELLDEESEDGSPSTTIEKETKVEDAAFIKVDKARMLAARDLLISMNKLQVEADAEDVVSKMIDTMEELSETNLKNPSTLEEKARIMDEKELLQVSTNKTQAEVAMDDLVSMIEAGRGIRVK